MAKPSRFDASTAMEFVTLNTYEAVTEKLKEIPDKLIIILFNVRYPDRFTLESKTKYWHKNFEKTHDVRFFKCVVVDGAQDFKEKLMIKHRPTVIFFLNNKEIDRIDDFDESKSDSEDTSKPNEESEDEKKLKKKIIKVIPKK